VLLTDGELAAVHRIAEREFKPLGTVAHELVKAALRRAK